VAHWRTDNLALFKGFQVIHSARAEVRSAVEGAGAKAHNAVEDAGAEVCSAAEGTVRRYVAQQKAQCEDTQSSRRRR